MIISFLGCPRSGKTTTASRVFANLKEASFGCEFVPEQARYYIAVERCTKKLSPTDKLTLTDEDQLSIMEKQLYYENVMETSIGQGSIIVTDSSPLNALLYMTPDYIESYNVKNLIKHALSKPTIYFYCAPVNWVGGLDPNRIHNQEESLQIDTRISERILPLLSNPPYTLLGDSETRWRHATSNVLKEIMNQT